jgi:hypothetical protein
MATRHARRLIPLVAMASILMTGMATAGPAVEIGPGARLVADGAALEIPLLVSCDSEGAAGMRSLFVQVRQAGGDAVASGSGFTDSLDCNGSLQEVGVAVLADPGSRPFHIGEAAVQAGLSICSSLPGASVPAVPGARTPAPASTGVRQAVPPPVAPADPPPGDEPAPLPPPDGRPCTTVNVSAVVFVHPMDMEGHHPEHP